MNLSRSGSEGWRRSGRPCGLPRSSEDYVGHGPGPQTQRWPLRPLVIPEQRYPRTSPRPHSWNTLQPEPGAPASFAQARPEPRLRRAPCRGEAPRAARCGRALLATAHARVRADSARPEGASPPPPLPPPAGPPCAGRARGRERGCLCRRRPAAVCSPQPRALSRGR